MRARAAWWPGVTLAVVASTSACDGFIRPPDPLEAHLDVVSVAIVLVAGESEARLLVAYPHRPMGAAAPQITAMLEGPGWSAAFSQTLELQSCARAPDRFGPARCLRAPLPEPIRPQAGYGIAGTALLGSFRGEIVVPAAPLLLHPVDTLRLQSPENRFPLEIPVRYQSDAGIGTLLAEALDVFRTEDDGSETRRDASYLGFPQPIDGVEADTVWVFNGNRPVRFSLQLVGLGWEYTDFLAQRGDVPVPRPWPSFGIEGEGVYGYFAGAAHSRIVHVQLTPGARRRRGTACAPETPGQSGREPLTAPCTAGTSFRYLP